ncbi:hypothetical protein BpHYR1_039386 [Brachionus plicatilis]|uniref:Uncharacterized protein n=1 Tax=Brachionus plicatilis TaxID=10195 RepID=A0A3M7SUY8_BRAPC|nr:hypothetical protein BpHYR1_039386 [Brachionus plicatilis]
MDFLVNFVNRYFFDYLKNGENFAFRRKKRFVSKKRLNLHRKIELRTHPIKYSVSNNSFRSFKNISQKRLLFPLSLKNFNIF